MDDGQHSVLSRDEDENNQPGTDSEPEEAAVEDVEFASDDDSDPEFQLEDSDQDTNTKDIKQGNHSDSDEDVEVIEEKPESSLDMAPIKSKPKSTPKNKTKGLTTDLD
jgi:hypothetical protein